MFVASKRGGGGPTLKVSCLSGIQDNTKFDTYLIYLYSLSSPACNVYNLK